MTTIPDSISATLTAQWTAAGGVLPTIYVTEDHVYSNPPPGGLDYIWIPAKSLLYNPKRMNDKYKNRTYTLELVANSATTADRLKEISDEIERVLDLYPIIGVTLQNITNRQIVTPERMNRPMEQITVTMVSLLTTSTSGYGANTSANYLNSLLMYGAANAAWVPAIYEATTEPGKVDVGAAYTITNVDGTDFWGIFRIPLPTAKGSLKLYISGYSAGILDADDGDYLTEIRLYGLIYSSATQVAVTTTDYKTAQKVEVTFAALDMSSYDSALLSLSIFATNANDFDLMFANVRCYYA